MEREQQQEHDQGAQLVVLREVATRAEADLIEALLRGEGIPCEVSPPPAHDGFAYWDAFTVTKTIRVHARDLARAQAVIAKHDGEERGAREEDFCPWCGEFAGDAEETCPHCGRSIAESGVGGTGYVTAHEPVPAQMREHSTTWRFVVLLVLAGLAVAVLTPWGAEMLRGLVEWLREFLAVTAALPMR